MAQKLATVSFSLALCVISYTAFAADRLTGVHSARVMSQSMPWIAEEAGLFRRYDIEFRLVYIGSSPLATAAMLGGDGEPLMDGGLVPPEYAELVSENLRKRLAGETAAERYEIDMIGLQGQMSRLEITSSVVEYDQGNAISTNDAASAMAGTPDPSPGDRATRGFARI